MRYLLLIAAMLTDTDAATLECHAPDYCGALRLEDQNNYATVSVLPSPPLGGFVLVTAETMTIDCCSEGDIYCPCLAGVHVLTSAKTLDDAARIMTEKASNSLASAEFVGVWPLDAKNRIELQHKTVKHPKKVRYEDEGWTEHVWVP